ncbi:helix-turn-helix domain-containing protein [Bacillus sp. PK3-056]|jgi:DNA-binding transcriptional ArsR family regulator|uniref:winged helix-turn-helix domain-containing protein n=1 Tax=Niallia circulans TaxID=1397 RepID=UPI000F4496E1|nr:helix-turn-helix domain-containing protein [Niallia circulans]AYV72432.1 hypothetical protein C2H98_13055 [Niallia circulans]
MMSSTNLLLIKSYDQLKAISDPLRIRIFSEITNQSKTGKQIGDILNIPAPKVHYHLKELEKVKIIYIEKTELLNGIAQKFYKTYGTDIVIDQKLFPHLNEMNESIRTSIYSILSNARNEAIVAPEESFSISSGEYMDWPLISIQTKVNINRQQFMKWKKKYHNLLNELANMENTDQEDISTFYISSVGFEVKKEKGEF